MGPSLDMAVAGCLEFCCHGAEFGIQDPAAAGWSPEWSHLQQHGGIVTLTGPQLGVLAVPWVLGVVRYTWLAQLFAHQEACEGVVSG